ncbi:MAG: flagellar biosynthesis protein FliQ [Sphingomonas adhaesiva]|uniref:flagellar biosynthesis protein FliQ n=1 Tax=Sphingomonas adhaesiva TaxID=28212 RepID=UPI002FF6E9A7
MQPLVDADYFLTVANQTMWVLALVSAPILIPALLSGLILGMVQAATSINEQTLSFVPKLVVVAVSIMVFGAMILGLLSDFTNEIFSRIPDLVR